MASINTATIDTVTIEVVDPEAADRFYTAAFGASSWLRTRAASDGPTAGFRGFTLSFIVSQPRTVDTLMGQATDAGAKTVKPAAKSLWGYGGVVQAPDGTICTIASSTKKNTDPATVQIDDVVLQLGVADVAASKKFYADHGFTVAKSYGRRYVQFDTGPVTLTLIKRDALAKVAGVPADGTGSHRLILASDAAPFTDPDGFAWEAPTQRAEPLPGESM